MTLFSQAIALNIPLKSLSSMSKFNFVLNLLDVSTRLIPADFSYFRYSFLLAFRTS